MTKKPPVPTAARTPKGPGSDPNPGETDVKAEKAPKNLREQGQPGNIEQNTRNQGHQQDR